MFHSFMGGEIFTRISRIGTHEKWIGGTMTPANKSNQLAVWRLGFDRGMNWFWSGHKIPEQAQLLRVVTARHGSAIRHMTVEKGQMLQRVGGFRQFRAELPAKLARSLRRTLSGFLFHHPALQGVVTVGDQLRRRPQPVAAGKKRILEHFERRNRGWLRCCAWRRRGSPKKAKQRRDEIANGRPGTPQCGKNQNPMPKQQPAKYYCCGHPEQK